MEMNETKINDNDLPGYEYMVRNIGAVLATKKRVREGLWVANAQQKEPGAKYKGKGAEAKKYGLLKDSMKTMDPTAWKMMKGKAMYQKKGDSLKTAKPEPWMMKVAAMRNRVHEDSNAYEKQVQRCNDVIADLVKAGVVANAADVKWFGLSDTELIVNGKKQPDALQKQLMTKHGVGKNNGLYYGQVQMQGTGVFIDNDPPHRSSELIQEQNMHIRELQQQGKANDVMVKATLEKQKETLKAQADLKRRQHAWLTENMAAQQLPAQRMKAFNTKQPFTSGSASLDRLNAAVIADLVADDVVRDKNDVLSFNLSNSILVVNGVVQSGDVHEKLKAKYLEHTYPQYGINDKWMMDQPDYGIHYSAVSQGIGIYTNVNER